MVCFRECSVPSSCKFTIDHGCHAVQAKIATGKSASCIPLGRCAVDKQSQPLWEFWNFPIADHPADWASHFLFKTGLPAHPSGQLQWKLLKHLWQPVSFPFTYAYGLSWTAASSITLATRDRSVKEALASGAYSVNWIPFLWQICKQCLLEG